MPVRKKAKASKKKMSLTRRVRRLEVENRKENKMLTTYSGAYANISPLTTSANCGYLNGIAQGDNQNTRDGNVIRAKSLLVRYSIQVNASSSNEQVRVTIFRDRRTEGDHPVNYDLFEDIDAGSSGYHIASPLATTNNPGRFDILYDKLHYLDPTNLPRQFFVEKFFPLNNKRIRFIGTQSTEGSAGPGSLYICIQGTVVANISQSRWMAKLVYYDD